MAGVRTRVRARTGARRSGGSASILREAEPLDMGSPGRAWEPVKTSSQSISSSNCKQFVRLFCRFKEETHVVFGSSRQDAVSQIEDVSAMTGFANCIKNSIANKRLRTKQHARIEISLNVHIGAQTSARVGHINCPIDADDIRAGCCHAFEEAGATGD